MRGRCRKSLIRRYPSPSRRTCGSLRGLATNPTRGSQPSPRPRGEGKPSLFFSRTAQRSLEKQTVIIPDSGTMNCRMRAFSMAGDPRMFRGRSGKAWPGTRGPAIMKLYHHPLSGHAHRARLFLALLGVPHEAIEVDLKAGRTSGPSSWPSTPSARCRCSTITAPSSRIRTPSWSIWRRSSAGPTGCRRPRRTRPPCNAGCRSRPGNWPTAPPPPGSSRCSAPISAPRR